MKSETKVKLKKSGSVQPRKRSAKVVQVKQVLPTWVIGAYDGPKNRELSLKEGYGS